METNRLRQLLVLSQSSHMRDAAALLGLSHSGLSKSIHQLEEDLGDLLIMKNGRNIELTDYARKILPLISDLLQREDVLRKNSATLSSQKTFKLGSFEVFSTHLLPSLIRELQGNYNVITMKEFVPGAIENAVVERLIDVGITYLPVPRAEIDHLHVSNIQMGIFARQGSSFLKMPLGDMPFVVPDSEMENAPTRMKGLDGWPDYQHPRNIAFRVDLMESALALLRTGLAVAYLPSFIARIQNQILGPEYKLDEIKLPSGIDRHQPVYLVKRKNRSEDATFKRIAKVLRAHRL